MLVMVVVMVMKGTSMVMMVKMMKMGMLTMAMGAGQGDSRCSNHMSKGLHSTQAVTHMIMSYYEPDTIIKILPVLLDFITTVVGALINPNW